jgi:hypothetical protein
MKFAFSLISFFIISLFASGQCQIDTSITHNEVGIYPDSATGLPHAITGQAYLTDIQVKVGVDTTFTDPITGLTFPAIIDSIVILNVFGLPSGFTYSCNPANCNFPGGSDGCISLQGLPPSPSMVGVYPLVVQLRGYGTVFSVPQSITQNDSDYVIVIDSTTGIGKIDRIQFSTGQNQPNPARGITNIPVTLLHPEHLTLSIFNILGEVVLTNNYSFQRGRFFIPVDVKKMQPGIYYYSVSNGKNSITKRMIISDL